MLHQIPKKLCPWTFWTFSPVDKIWQHNVLQPKWEDENWSSNSTMTSSWRKWMISCLFCFSLIHIHHKAVLQSWLDFATHLLLECPSILGMRLSFYLTSSLWTFLDYMNDVNLLDYCVFNLFLAQTNKLTLDHFGISRLYGWVQNWFKNHLKKFLHVRSFYKA
jgi:hypothetical protein